MSKTFEQGKDEIARIVDHFGKHAQFYRSGEYREANARQELIDPMFMALGWDVRNENHTAPQYREVVSETSLDIEGHKKSPDYVFRVGQTSKFYAEAKKPSVSIKNDPLPAQQLRHYAWNAKLPLSVLTDFDEFAVYHCRIRPKPGDKAAIARVNFLTFDEYPDRWRELWDVFSRDAVWGGEFDRYAQTSLGKRGTSEVDAEFLKEIEGWRELLARNIALRNAKISIDELNTTVQLTIDRIIFLRMAEDRGIEPYEQLRKLADSENIYNRFIKGPCRKADEKYNSGLFDFTKDKLTPRLDIDDKVIEGILKRLYFPESPYNFRLMPVEILGNVYEQFLGKVIRLTEGHHAKIEEKPEVKKAGGVYYTPAYIVEYIVKNTVGAMLAHNFNCRPLTPTLSPWEREKKEVASALLPPLPRSTALPPLPRGEGWGEGTTIKIAAHEDTQQKKRKDKFPADLFEFRVLDMACGSGSFLLGAYKYLLDFYLKWYTENKPEKSPKAVWKMGDEWRLTIGEKKRILLTHIFGVDIDRQAVEVTKLSLLLKVLEGESDETLMKQQQLALWQDRALPDLDKNIKCGNSLIGTDYFTDRLIPDPIEMRRVNPFDWDREFPEAMKAGGFDCIIGNPPYGAEITEVAMEFISQKYKATNKDLDTYSLFMEKAVQLCKPLGRVSMIVPTGWYSGVKFRGLRRFIACATNPFSFINLPYDVFKAWVDTTIFVVTKRNKPTIWPRSDSCMIQLRTFPKRHRILSEEEFENGVMATDMIDWFANENDEFLTYADSLKTMLIRKIQNHGQTLQEYADIQRGVTPFSLTDKPTHKSSRIAFDGTVRRYILDRGSIRYIRFDKTLAEPKPERYFKGTRILLRELISRQFRLQAVKASEEFITNKSMQSILILSKDLDLNYLLGLINSHLMSWYFLNRSQIAQRDDFPKIVLKETRTLPICPINFSDPTDKARHDRMVLLVEQMLELHKRKAEGKGEADRSVYDRQIAATDGEIDRLVYELYGLTEEEIKIVEGN